MILIIHFERQKQLTAEIFSVSFVKITALLDFEKHAHTHFKSNHRQLAANNDG